MHLLPLKSQPREKKIHLSSTSSSMPKAVQSQVLSRFPVEHAIACGLKVLERSPATGEVVSVRCQFCVYFDIEEGSEPRQRAKKETKKTWTNKPLQKSKISIDN